MSLAGPVEPAARSQRLPGLGDSPLDLLTECRCEALDGRELRVELARLKARDGRLRRSHARRDRGLRESERRPPRRELAEKLPPAQRRLDQLWKLGIPLGALADELIQEVFAVGHVPQYSVFGISLLRLRSASAAPVRQTPLCEHEL